MKRKKQKTFYRRLRRTLGGLSFIFVFSATVFFAGKTMIARWQASAQKTDSPLSFKPESYSTNMPEFAYELDSFFSTFKKLAFSSPEADSARKDFLDKYTEIKNMRITPNYLTGDVNIRLEPRRAVSEIKLSGKKAYLAEDGTIMAKASGKKPELPFAVSLSSSDISEHLPQFIEKLGEKHEMFAMPLKTLECGTGENSCVLWLKDGTRVDWGTIFYTTRKIEELNNILAAVSDKTGKHTDSLNIDMRYCVSLGRSFYKKISKSSEKDITAAENFTERASAKTEGKAYSGLI